MAKVQVNNYKKKRVRRKGVHAKTKQSKSKGSSNYKKPYASQGRWLCLITSVLVERQKKSQALASSL